MSDYKELQEWVKGFKAKRFNTYTNFRAMFNIRVINHGGYHYIRIKPKLDIDCYIILHKHESIPHYFESEIVIYCDGARNIRNGSSVSKDDYAYVMDAAMYAVDESVKIKVNKVLNSYNVFKDQCLLSTYDREWKERVYRNSDSFTTSKLKDLFEAGK